MVASCAPFIIMYVCISVCIPLHVLLMLDMVCMYEWALCDALFC